MGRKKLTKNPFVKGFRAQVIFYPKSYHNRGTNAMEELRECIICTFTDSQETLIDTPDGWAHQECLDDQQAELKAEHSAISELSNEKLL